MPSVNSQDSARRETRAPSREQSIVDWLRLAPLGQLRLAEAVTSASWISTLATPLTIAMLTHLQEFLSKMKLLMPGSISLLLAFPLSEIPNAVYAKMTVR